jgi:hypothetical protein
MSGFYLDILLSHHSNTTTMALFADFSTFDMYMALIVPLACVVVTSTMVVANCMHHRKTKVPKPPTKVAQKSPTIAEVPGDTVEMFVELEADEEVNSNTRRTRVHEVEGRGINGAQRV